MSREELIKKWLNHELNAEETEAFHQLEEYQFLNTLSRETKRFKSPDFNNSQELQSVLRRINSKKSKSKTWLSIAMSVAAIFAICVGFYYYSTTLDTTFKTSVAEKRSIELPDASLVMLNSMSELSFNTSQWKNHREVQLEGEAYFKVAKGSKFEVQTLEGIVTVLGTQFNIKQRKDYFEVECYEGLVKVKSASHLLNLNKGQRFLIRNGHRIDTDNETNSAPSWIDNYSQFKSIPYGDVLAEFERQYDLKIDLISIDDTQLFTGNFPHDDLETALKSITLPLHLTYAKTNHTITLKRE